MRIHCDAQFWRMTEPEHRTEVFNRRGCITLAVAAALFVLLVIAISLGWLGHVHRQKNIQMPVVENNQA
jgi:hypothetical protein